jgi:hypothetical protein
MKYSVDKIENNIATLESLYDKTKKEVSIEILPKQTKEGSIIIFENNQYTIDNSLEKERRISIQNKFNALKKRKVDNN